MFLVLFVAESFMGVMEPDESAADKKEKNETGIDNLPYMLMLQQNVNNQVMTDEQLETLRKQICVYSTICSQLVEMHKVMSQQASASPEHMLYDPGVAGPGFRQCARQRWTPSQTQLHILERLYECSNGTPNKQKLKEITNELSQHGPISETNVYNWFQNRKARAKRKQQLLPQKEFDSEVDTDGESSREKKPKIEGDSNNEYASLGYIDKAAEACERNHGLFLSGSEQAEEKPQIQERNHEMYKVCPVQEDTNAQICEQKYGLVRMNPFLSEKQQFSASQDNASSSLLLLQTQAQAPSDDFLERSGSATIACTANDISQSNQQEPGLMTVLLDGNPWKVPIAVVDIRKVFGDNAVLLDSHGHVVPTNDAGVTFHPLHASESYRLLRHIDIKRGMSVKSSSELLTHNFHHIPGILNER